MTLGQEGARDEQGSQAAHPQDAPPVESRAQVSGREAEARKPEGAHGDRAQQVALEDSATGVAAIGNNRARAGLDVAPVTAPTPDAVAQARERINWCFAFYHNASGKTEKQDAAKHLAPALDALIAAVRAECAAKVRALPNWSSKHDGGPWVNRDEVLAALEAHP